MTRTTVDNLDATGSKIIERDSFPQTPAEFYGERAAEGPGSNEWVGGEMFLFTETNRIYLNTATSGTVASWRQAPADFDTTTSTSTSTSTSSSTSSSTSTSSTTTSA